MIYFIRRSVCRLSLTLGIFAYIEIAMNSLEGTKPNYLFPWGYYRLTWAISGLLLLGVAYATWQRPLSADSDIRRSRRS